MAIKKVKIRLGGKAQEKGIPTTKRGKVRPKEFMLENLIRRRKSTPDALHRHAKI